jgi:hypothetical protein
MQECPIEDLDHAARLAVLSAKDALKEIGWRPGGPGRSVACWALLGAGAVSPRFAARAGSTAAGWPNASAHKSQALFMREAPT